jgi:Protein of unknown function (DUF2924)
MEGVEDCEIPPLETLDTCTLAELRALFEGIFGSRPRPRARVEFLKANIAWASQAIREKRDPLRLRQELAAKAKRSPAGKSPYHRPGTCLVREWQGETYEVTVLESGYRWQGETYRSLSRIAREITGAHWSGPRFFGLQDPSA